MKRTATIDEETRIAVHSLYQNALKKDVELNVLRRERSSIRFIFVRLIVLMGLNVKRLLFRVVQPFAGVATDVDRSSQKRANGKPAVISYTPSDEQKKRIAHFIPTLVTGGSQQLVVDLMQSISDYNHVIVTGRISGPVGYVGVPNYLLPLEQGSGADLSEFIKEFRPDLLHVHFWATIENLKDWKWYESVFKYSLALGLPVIQNCNNPTFPYFDSRIRRNIYVSHYAARVFGLNAPGSKVIYPGSNFGKFRRSSPYEPLDTIGMVYRLERDKLNELSIEPLIQVVKNRPSTKVFIIGGGSWYELYNSRVKEEGLSGSFVFTGYVSYDDLPDYYQKLGLFVAPVYQESFGQVAPFAMNMGIPVVGYNVGALAEIIDDASLLAPSQNVFALSRIILDLLENKQRMRVIGRRNQDRAQSLFSLDTMISEYRKIYVEVLTTG